MTAGEGRSCPPQLVPLPKQGAEILVVLLDLDLAILLHPSSPPFLYGTSGRPPGLHAQGIASATDVRRIDSVGVPWTRSPPGPTTRTPGQMMSRWYWV